MTLLWSRLLETLDAQGAVALASVVAVAGSAPRDAGARMVVRPDGGFWGTVGGGQLEWRLLEQARAALAAGRGAAQIQDWPLGPELGQCCGGRVSTWVETFDASDREAVAALAQREARGPFTVAAAIRPDGRVERRLADPSPSFASTLPRSSRTVLERHGDERTPVLLFGAGHVGRALAQALAPLPFKVFWFDPRPEAFPSLVPQNAVAHVLQSPADAVAAAPAGAFAMVMTHLHPLDLSIVAAALARIDLGPVGLIGSATKRARFLARLRQSGLSEGSLRRLHCPIGVAGVTGKEPAVIAASAAAQLLQWQEAGRAACPSTPDAGRSHPRRLSGECA